ncbi:MAG: DUF3467 domain-containing protein [Deltaproteobacteria bacterium]|nr:DUF3467 domain-containing protein [Deltaproteobacteria bacterium]
MAHEKEIKINFPQDKHGGVYANSLFVGYTREEFIIDFIMAAPPAGAVTARIVTAPAHMKRFLAALQDNIKKYEETFGEIKPAMDPKGPFGFNA